MGWRAGIGGLGQRWDCGVGELRLGLEGIARGRISSLIPRFTNYRASPASEESLRGLLSGAAAFIKSAP